MATIWQHAKFKISNLRITLEGNQREVGGRAEGGGESESNQEQGVEDEEGDRGVESGETDGSKPGGCTGR